MEKIERHSATELKITRDEVVSLANLRARRQRILDRLNEHPVVVRANKEVSKIDSLISEAKNLGIN